MALRTSMKYERKGRLKELEFSENKPLCKVTILMCLFVKLCCYAFFARNT